MADLKAKRILGGTYTADDTLELQLTYTGQAHSCNQYIEVLSGPTVTHGGGASASTPLHYKSAITDADGDGIIDYSTSQMTVVQASKGTSVIKVVANVLLKADVDTWQTNYNTWLDTYTSIVVNEDGNDELVLADGAPDAPVYPTATTYKSGEITLKWEDDTFV